MNSCGVAVAVVVVVGELPARRVHFMSRVLDLFFFFSISSPGELRSKWERSLARDSSAVRRIRGMSCIPCVTLSSEDYRSILIFFPYMASTIVGFEVILSLIFTFSRPENFALVRFFFGQYFGFGERVRHLPFFKGFFVSCV